MADTDNDPLGPLNLVMNGEDVMAIVQVGAGLKGPTIIIQVVPDDDQEDGVRISVETWGLPPAPRELAEFLTGIGDWLTEEMDAQAAGSTEHPS